MTQHADPRNALPEVSAHDPQDAQAVRETLAEWLEHQVPRVLSGAYIADLEDRTAPGTNPVVDICYLALTGAGMAYRFAEERRDEGRMNAASELEEEVGAVVRAVLPPDRAEEVMEDATSGVTGRLEGGAS